MKIKRNDKKATENKLPVSALARPLAERVFAEPGRIPPTPDETEANKLLLTALTMMTTSFMEDTLKKRCEKIGNNKMFTKYRQGVGCLNSCWEKLLESLPTVQQKWLVAFCSTHHVCWVEGDKHEGWYNTSEDVLAILVNAVMANECAICCKEGAEEDGCPIRYALDKVVTASNEEGRFGGCAFKQVCTANELGDYYYAEEKSNAQHQ